MNGWGGKRAGAGRKPLSGEARRYCTLKANAKEWEIILDFAKIVKHGDRQAAINFVQNHNVD